VLELAQAELEAHIALRAGGKDEAIKHWRHAETVEAALPYDEPPTWYLPVAGRLGAALLEAGHHREAESVYRASLQKYPNNGWNLFGLLQSCQRHNESSKEGNTIACDGIEGQFHHAWRYADVRLDSSADVEQFLWILEEGQPIKKALALAPFLATLGAGAALALGICRPSPLASVPSRVDFAPSSDAAGMGMYEAL